MTSFTLLLIPHFVQERPWIIFWKNFSILLKHVFFLCFVLFCPRVLSYFFFYILFLIQDFHIWYFFYILVLFQGFPNNFFLYSCFGSFFHIFVFFVFVFLAFPSYVFVFVFLRRVILVFPVSILSSWPWMYIIPLFSTLNFLLLTLIFSFSDDTSFLSLSFQCTFN